VPFLDKGVERTGKSPVFSVIGVVALAYMVGMTAWGYRSWVPIWIVLATVAFVYVLRWGTQRVKPGGGS